MDGIPRFTPSLKMGETYPPPPDGAGTAASASPSRHTDGGRPPSHDAADEVVHRPGASLQSRLVQAARTQASPREAAMLLAQHPERIANKLVKDAEFRQAYVAFIDQLTRLNNGSVAVHDAASLRLGNALALEHLGHRQETWEKTPYSTALFRLREIQNSTISASPAHVEDAVEDLIRTMRAMPEKRLLWTINGNNHFPTHQGLKPLLRRIAESRAAQGGFPGRGKDVILISGNAAGRTPFSAGPVVKYTTADGKFVGESSEAAAIESLLKDPLITDHFVFELETRAANTRENIAYANERLQEKGEDIADFITVNSQSGFSGLRSALTLLGAANKGDFPATIHLVNPDREPEENVRTADYQTTGKTAIQALREFMNLTADVSRSFYIPPVPLPPGLIDSFKSCLRKIHIDPDAMTAHDVQQLLREMHETAMRPDEKMLVNPREGYASAVQIYAADSKALRAQQDVVQKMMNRRAGIAPPDSSP